eukprot:gb/GFBE01022757.1/.p1 GENE.gb/GFBE01022757.1/~~gb/GFBE01022757.1/.p1  ORF type:complete len:264 (+),score=28.29 gb/GFBE01022757.1/:1-792(+)
MTLAASKDLERLTGYVNLSGAQFADLCAQLFLNDELSQGLHAWLNEDLQSSAPERASISTKDYGRAKLWCAPRVGERPRCFSAKLQAGIRRHTSAAPVERVDVGVDVSGNCSLEATVTLRDGTCLALEASQLDDLFIEKDVFLEACQDCLADEDPRLHTSSPSAPTRYFDAGSVKFQLQLADESPRFWQGQCTLTTMPQEWQLDRVKASIWDVAALDVVTIHFLSLRGERPSSKRKAKKCSIAQRDASREAGVTCHSLQGQSL